MKNPLQKLSMRKRMMLYFSVPLILVQILLCLLCYPQLPGKNGLFHGAVR